MPKSLTLGNGNILIGLDKFGQLYDLYFPYVGLENHVGSKYLHKLGVFVDDSFSWLDDGSWVVSVKSASNTLQGLIEATSTKFGLKIYFEDTVYNEKNIFLRHITVENLQDREREIKFVLNHQFEIYESHRGDTAYYDPLRKVLIHYKGRRLFLANLLHHSQAGILDYS